MNMLVTVDCVEQMQQMEDGSVDLVFADPPFNIGYDYYGEYEDNMSPTRYREWSCLWMKQVMRILKPHGTFWLAIGDEWAAELKVMASTEFFLTMRSWVIWYYTFGVNCTNKLTRSHAHLLYFVKDPGNFTFNADTERVPSARALVYNDKRANPDGRLPDDTWVIRPQELDEQAFPEFGNTWHIPRISGTFKQRIDGAPNQMPEQLLGRIIRLCSNDGDLVYDPFAGSGTTLAVAKKLNRLWLGAELSPKFSSAAARRIAAVRAGDQLDGPIPQGTTTNG